MSTSASTTPTVAAPPARSTKTRRVELGEIVLVTLEEGIQRPLLVSAAGPVRIFTRVTPGAGDEGRVEFRVSGTLFCEPDDHTRPALRGWSAGGADPARIHGRPDRLLPIAFGESLAEGAGIGQWTRRAGEGG